MAASAWQRQRWIVKAETLQSLKYFLSGPTLVLALEGVIKSADFGVRWNWAQNSVRVLVKWCSHLMRRGKLRRADLGNCAFYQGETSMIRSFYSSFTWQCNNREYKNIPKVKLYTISNCSYLKQPWLGIFAHATYTSEDSWVPGPTLPTQTGLNNEGNGLSQNWETQI